MPRDIRIHPKFGSTSSNDFPRIDFGGLSASTTISLRVDDDGSVVYTGTYGALFNISDSKEGILHSVNDVSGLPILQVSSNDYVQMGKWDKYSLVVNSDKVGIGLTGPTYALHVIGTVSTTGFQMTNGAASNYIIKSDSQGVATWQEDVDTFFMRLNASSLSLAASTTYYGAVLSVASVITSSTFHRYITPFSCKIIGYHVYSYNATTTASAGTSSLWLRVNKTTDYLLTSTISFAGAPPVASEYANNSSSITLNANDIIEFKLITPAWATPPANAGVFLDLFAKRTW